MRKLKNHILRRLRQGTERLDDDTIYSAQDHSGLIIRGNRIYEHKTIRINYTTYDIRRDSDTITSRHPGIMLLSNEDPLPDNEETVHPYWYARVLKIFHVFVSDTNGGSMLEKRMDILWVRWFGIAGDWVGGWQGKRTLRLGYVPGIEDGFGFVDPSEVVRGCFLLPVREFTHTRDLLDPPSSLASDHPVKGDYRYYDLIQYVPYPMCSLLADILFISWVDRDMFMRYCGGGPGHHGMPICMIAWNPMPKAPHQHNTLITDATPLEEISSSEPENEDDGSDFEPEALDLLLEEPTGNFEYGF
jgi:hypothetical protein